MKERIEALVPRVGRLGRHLPRPLRPAAPELRPAGRDRPGLHDLRPVRPPPGRQGRDGAARTGGRRGHPRTGRRRDQPGQERPGHARGHVQARGRPRPGRHRQGLRGAIRSGSRPSSAVDFDDLLVHMVTILKEHKDVRAELDARFRYVLVDEYQDTNLAQYAIVRALSVDHPNLCVTGDPDQSIYGWRGANLDEHPRIRARLPRLQGRQARAELPQHQEHPPAPPTHLIRHNLNRKAKSLPTENPQGQPVELTIYATETDEAHGVAAKIVELVREGEYAYRDIAVFCRVTALTRGFEQAFRAAKIPYQVVGGRLVLRAAGDQGRPGVPEPDGQSQGRRGVQPGGQRPAAGIGKTSLEHLAERAEALGLPLLAMARRGLGRPRA